MRKPGSFCILLAGLCDFPCTDDVRDTRDHQFADILLLLELKGRLSSHHELFKGGAFFSIFTVRLCK